MSGILKRLTSFDCPNKSAAACVCVHMWKTGVLQQLLPESVNTLPFFQRAFLPFPCSAQLYLDYITFYSILSFELIAERRARWKNSSAEPNMTRFSDFLAAHVQKNELTWAANPITTYLRKKTCSRAKFNLCQMFSFHCK